MVRPGPLDLDWPRISRWCFLAALVMLLWLLVPVARCSWASFRATPIGEVAPQEAAPGPADGERVEQRTGFWSTWGSSMKQCYLQTPLLGQEPWKRNLLLGFGAATVLAWIASRIRTRGRRTFGDP